MKKRGLYFKFLLILLLTAAAVYLVIPAGSKIGSREYKLKLGLDLQGGTHLVYEGNLKDIPGEAQKDAISSARDVIERRVNGFGVSEPVVQVSGSNRIIVELPGIKNIDEAINLIGQTPFLEFREENPNPNITPDAQGQVNLNAEHRV